MKNTVTFAILFLVFASSAFANEQETSISTIIPQKRDEIKLRTEEKRTLLQQQIQDKRDEIKARVTLQDTATKTKLHFLAQDRVSKILSIIFERFEAVLVKFDGIVVRIEARIAKLDDQGIATSEAKDLLQVAKAKIEDSTTLVAATIVELQTTLSGPTSIEDLKNSVEACKTSLKEAHSSLVEVVSVLKGSDSVVSELLAE